MCLPFAVFPGRLLNTLADDLKHWCLHMTTGGCCDIWEIHRTLSLLDLAFSVSFLIWNSEDHSLLQVELTATGGVDAWIPAVNLLHSMVFTDIPIRNSFSDRLFSRRGRGEKEGIETKLYQFQLICSLRWSDSEPHLVTKSQGDRGQPCDSEWRLAVVEARIDEQPPALLLLSNLQILNHFLPES